MCLLLWAYSEITYHGGAGGKVVEKAVHYTTARKQGGRNETRIKIQSSRGCSLSRPTSFSLVLPPKFSTTFNSSTNNLMGDASYSNCNTLYFNLSHFCIFSKLLIEFEKIYIMVSPSSLLDDFPQPWIRSQNIQS